MSLAWTGTETYHTEVLQALDGLEEALTADELVNLSPGKPIVDLPGENSHGYPNAPASESSEKSFGMNFETDAEHDIRKTGGEGHRDRGSHHFTDW